MSEAGSFYIDKLRERAQRYAIADCALNTEIMAAELGNKAGCMGAASLSKTIRMKKNFGMLALIMAFWFTISFITNILGPLIPDIIANFNLKDLAMAGFIPTSFFLGLRYHEHSCGIAH